MDLIKLSSLTRAEKLCFIKQANGNFILSKKMIDKPWDQGSVWKIVKDAEGNKFITRIDCEKDIPKDYITTAFNNLCTTCNTQKISCTVGPITRDFCPVCEKEAMESFKNFKPLSAKNDFSKEKNCFADFKGGILAYPSLESEALNRKFDKEIIKDNIEETQIFDKLAKKDMQTAYMNHLQSQAISLHLPLKAYIAMHETKHPQLVRIANEFVVEIYKKNTDPDTYKFILTNDANGQSFEIPVEDNPKDLRACTEEMFIEWVKAHLPDSSCTDTDMFIL